MHEYHYEYFSELRTYPSGWDFSTYLDSREAEGQKNPARVDPDWGSVKFSELSTIPTGWDVSVLK